MIRKAENVNVADKKIRILVAGYPGIGKSTLALSAPKPLVLTELNPGIARTTSNLSPIRKSWRT